MTGHERILAMRRSGIKPTVVWVNDMAGYRPDPEDKAIAVSVHGDTPEACDFRFLHGIKTVIFESTSTDRTDRFRDELMRHVDRVVATTWISENDATVRSVTDTEGELNWLS